MNTCQPNGQSRQELEQEWWRALPEAPLLRVHEVTPLYLTLHWILNLVAVDPVVRSIVLRMPAFIALIWWAHSEDGENNPDHTMEILVENFQSVLSSTFEIRRKDSPNA
jgi:hypothetical protein